MKKQKLIINNAEVKARAVHIINNLDVEKPSEVVIREYKVDRSAAQNSLYWSWLTIIGDQLGETKNDLHERYKGMFLVPIYERDDSEYAQMISALRSLYAHDQKTALYLREQIIRLTSTTKAKVKQFAEYLDDIEKDVSSLHISLPHLDDYELAMGRVA